MFKTFWSKGAAVFTQLQDTAIRVVAFPSSNSPGRKRILNNLGIRAQRWEFVIRVQRNRNVNLRDPFFPFRRSNCCCPVWAVCVLHTSPSNLTRNGSSTKNLHFILLKDAFLERCDTASMSTNKNPTEKCCLFFFFFLILLWGLSTSPHCPMILFCFPHLFSLLSRVLLRCWTCQRPSRCLSSTQPSIFLLKPPQPRSTFTSLIAPLLHFNKLLKSS